MTSIKAFIIFFLLLSSSVLFAQDALIFSGTVLDIESYKPLEKAIFKHNGQIHPLNTRAEFKINVKPHDTITFRHLGYKSFEIIITDTTTMQTLPRVIVLETSNITLDEVEVNNFVLTDEMKNNAQRNVQMAVQGAYKKEGLTYRESNPQPKGSGTGLSASETFGANLFTVIDEVKKTKKRTPPPPTMKIISYEEYQSTRSQSVDTSHTNE